MDAVCSPRTPSIKISLSKSLSVNPYVEGSSSECTSGFTIFSGSRLAIKWPRIRKALINIRARKLSLVACLTSLIEALGIRLEISFSNVTFSSQSEVSAEVISPFMSLGQFVDFQLGPSAFSLALLESSPREEKYCCQLGSTLWGLAKNLACIFSR